MSDEIEPEIGNDLEQAIGRVAIAHSALQRVLESMVWELAGLDRESGSVVTGEMAFASLARAANALAEQKHPEWAFRGRFAGQVQRADDARNRILHSRWLVPGDPEADVFDRLLGIESGKALRAKYSRKQGSDQRELLDPKAIDRTASEIQDLAVEIGALILKSIGREALAARVFANLTTEQMEDLQGEFEDIE